MTTLKIPLFSEVVPGWWINFTNSIKFSEDIAGSIATALATFNGEQTIICQGNQSYLDIKFENEEYLMLFILRFS